MKCCIYEELEEKLLAIEHCDCNVICYRNTTSRSAAKACSLPGLNSQCAGSKQSTALRQLENASAPEAKIPQQTFASHASGS